MVKHIINIAVRISIRGFFLIALALLAFSGGGCQTRVCDARGPSDMCEIHNAYMDSVKLSYQKNPVPNRDYLEARLQYFPHASPFLMSPQCPECVFYLCDFCVRAETEWLKKHPSSGMGSGSEKTSKP